jgi:hypothetical protein
MKTKKTGDTPDKDKTCKNCNDYATFCSAAVLNKGCENWHPMPKDNDKWQKLFNYMKDEHGIHLVETEMQEIEKILFPPDYPYVVKDNDTSLEEKHTYDNLQKKTPSMPLGRG